MKKTDALARLFVSDQLQQIQQARPFLFHADPAMVMTRLQLWLRREPGLSADRRLAELLAMVGGRQANQRVDQNEEKKFPEDFWFWLILLSD